MLWAVELAGAAGFEPSTCGLRNLQWLFVDVCHCPSPYTIRTYLTTIPAVIDPGGRQWIAADDFNNGVTDLRGYALALLNIWLAYPCQTLVRKRGHANTHKANTRARATHGSGPGACNPLASAVYLVQERRQRRRQVARIPKDSYRRRQG